MSVFPFLVLGTVMYFSGRSLDDLLLKVYRRLLSGKLPVVDATKGSNKEITGVMLQLRDPRARLSRTETKGKLFSGIGELLWYLAASDDLDFINYYIPGYGEFAEENGKIHGAYGPRIFSDGENSQFKIVQNMLSKRAGTRKAVIQLFDALDLRKEYKDVPCTCTLQFFVRKSKLDLVVYMRSNDAYLGLPHDIFSFTMIQEVMARSLGCDVGIYKHTVGSLHLYERHIEKAQQYVEEDFQDYFPMPSMPFGDPWPAIRKVLDAESKIRSGTLITEDISLHPYWTDVIRILQFYYFTRNPDRHHLKAAAQVKQGLHHDVYKVYFESKHRKMLERQMRSPQMEIFYLENNDDK